jgi:hypothetical protein
LPQTSGAGSAAAGPARDADRASVATAAVNQDRPRRAENDLLVTGDACSSVDDMRMVMR